ncbi:MAG TPA: hypothetical protein VLA56_01420 [Pseudomonadales bacterium]|nr:hypothetical protein [Pseudomonadales bacterium]
MPEALTNDAQLLARFPLGQHLVILTQTPDGTLSLWLDGCLRKRRGRRGTAAYLWTNVELPFEDHHLVEVRRPAGEDAQVQVTVNGEVVDTGPDATAPNAV